MTTDEWFRRYLKSGGRMTPGPSELARAEEPDHDGQDHGESQAFWLYRCDVCGHEATKLVSWSERTLRCPQSHCLGIWERVYEAAPAAHDDTLTGGARWMHNLGDHPVWVTTNTQLKHELKSRGLVQDVRDNHAKHDQSPWATRERLKVDQVDPFVPQGENVEPEPDMRPEPVPSSTGTMQRSTGAITLSEGPDAEQQEVGTIQMSMGQLRIFRSYRNLLQRMGLRPELFCKDCWDKTREDACKVQNTIDEVYVVCGCTIRFGRGETAITSGTLPLPPRPSALSIVNTFVPQVTLDSQVAALFRRFNRELHNLRLVEALYCDVCFERGNPDGCDARVMSTGMHVRCRCQERVFTGYTT